MTLDALLRDPSENPCRYAFGARCSPASHAWFGTFILVSTAGHFGCVEDAEHSEPVRRFTDRRGLNPPSGFVQDGRTLVEGAR